jgi:hypothetical protein
MAWRTKAMERDRMFDSMFMLVVSAILTLICDYVRSLGQMDATNEDMSHRLRVDFRRRLRAGMYGI